MGKAWTDADEKALLANSDLVEVFVPKVGLWSRPPTLTP